MSNYIEYACDVLNGRIPACKWVRLACERFNSDLGRSDLNFSDEEADKQFVIYATGAPIRFSDRPKIDAILEKSRRENYGLRTLIHEVVKSDLFLYK